MSSAKWWIQQHNVVHELTSTQLWPFSSSLVRILVSEALKQQTTLIELQLVCLLLFSFLLFAVGKGENIFSGQDKKSKHPNTQKSCTLWTSGNKEIWSEREEQSNLNEKRPHNGCRQLKSSHLKNKFGRSLCWSKNVCNLKTLWLIPLWGPLL